MRSTFGTEDRAAPRSAFMPWPYADASCQIILFLGIHVLVLVKGTSTNLVNPSEYLWNDVTWPSRS